MHFLWRERKGFVKNVKKRETVSEITAAGEYHTSFQSPNMQHVARLTEQWREMASLLGNTEILSKLHIDVRATNCFTTVNA